ncbi:S1/P1 nuclease [Frateuria soli]|uniref:S1/P1 nuclease n=1 Tax=Frateuria soli TaxID=1542730 RepID=UPI001E467C95|nr:S1/P1 nuclease [Frateuria soli]UGB37590.1 S1/P1 nuclease [Frateuria soli]
MIVLRRFVVVLLAGFLLLPEAHAWGPDGHRIVAEIAQRHLDPAAEAQVARLLAGHADRLAEVANWADDIQDDPAQQALWKATRSLHYINFRGPDCAYQPPRDCRDGRCVVAGLAHYVAVLGDPGQSVEARREALEFVVHFVGDVHQPLHAGYRPDKGGNTYQVRFQGRGSNLHRVWDSGMLRTRGLDWQDYARWLDAGGPAGLPPVADAPFATWAEESCRLSRDVYPPGHGIDAPYVEAELPLAERRLREAGRRLAALLNRTLG